MRNINLSLILLLLSLGVVSTGYAKTATVLGAGDVSMTKAILVEVNNYRKKHHLTPLTMDSRISKQAATHSQNMARQALPFGHTDFLNRVKALRSQINNAGAASENVAYNYKDAQDVVKNWVLSSGHLRNIVGNYNLTGIGIARDASGKLYFTQIFIKTSSSSYVSKAQQLPHFSFGSIFKRSLS